MADQERDKDRDAATQGDDATSGAQTSSREGRTVGRGMTSPDSTQAVLSAETGEPDPRARGDGGSQSTDTNRSNR